MKHHALALVEVIVVLLILAILAALFMSIFSHPNVVPRRSQCQSNLKQIGWGFIQYAQDYNEKFPAVAASVGWAQTLQPYTKSWQIFHCPSVDSQSAEPTTDYFSNARAANVNLEKFESVSLSILAGDGLSGQTTNAVLSALPASWISDAHSPAHRHFVSQNSVGAVYLFADGHSKYLQPQQITRDKPALGKPTFLVK